MSGNLRVACCTAALALTSLLNGSSFAVEAATSSSAARGPRADYFPNVVLKTHDGRVVHFYDDLIEGKVVLINFMYTRCTGSCPGSMANLVQVQHLLGDELGREIHMYTISLDPENDTPAALKEYADKIGAKAGWTFLTGAKEDIEALRKKLGFVDPDPELDADRSGHSGMVLFGNERLDRWSACPALLKPEQLARSARSIHGQLPGKK